MRAIAGAIAPIFPIGFRASRARRSGLTLFVLFARSRARSMSDIDTTNTQGKLPGSKAELKAKGPEINHKNVNTVGHETVTGKAGDDAKRNVKRKGGGGGAGRKPARDACADYSDESGALDPNDPNYDDYADLDEEE